MQKIPKEQLRKRFQILADTLQDVIFSENSSASVRKAAVLGDIEGKVTLLAEMTGLALMGFLNPSDFSEELQKELGITADIARQIESSLNAEVFSLVQTELKKLYPPTIKTPTVISPSFAPSHAKASEGKPATPIIATPAPLGVPLGGATAKLEAAQPSISEFEKRFFKPAFVTPQHDYGEAKPASAESYGEAKPASAESYGEAKPASAESYGEAKQAPNPPLGGATAKLAESYGEAKPASADLSAVALAKEEGYGEAKPKIKPVVPLPTYIQSQFQRRSSYAEASSFANLPAEASAQARATADKPTDKEPTESQYREKMEEKTPSTQPKPHPKISGNVIDLRNRS